MTSLSINYSVFKMMKSIVFSVVILLLPGSLVSQIDNNGCLADQFGVDADLYSGMIQFGDGSPALNSDDWFLGASGRNIIDQSNTAAIQTILSGASPNNKLFEARMSQGIFSIIDNRLWVDAVYARDHFGGTGFVDSTAFAISSKNGQDPASWGTGITNVLGKNDLIDIAGYMRRQEPSPAYPVPPAPGGQMINYLRGDLWFYGLITRAEPGGDAYMDFEFYIEDLSFNKTTYKFNSGGPQMGHTAFAFDPTGKITKLGDVIFNVSLTGGGTVPNIELRIWMSKANFDAFRASPPVNLPFNLQAEFDGAINGAAYGYARITPKFPEQACGKVNVASENPTIAPWGHRGTKANIYIAPGGTHLNYSVAEVAMNMSLYGIDNSLLDGADLCSFPYQTFIVKTRSSGAFTAALKDFGGPYSWGKPTAYAAAGGLLSCLNTSTTLSATPVRTDVSYQWSTLNGNIVGSSNTATITVNQPGTYTLNYLLPTGCPAPPVNVVVGYDPTKPFYISASATGNVACTPTSGAADLTVSGATLPYTYNWSNGATTQDLSGVPAGTYTVTVTDALLPAGCTITTTATVASPVPISITPVVTNVLCNGGNNGSINLTVTGKSPFTYQWSNGNLTEDIANLTAGTYTVTVTDADGCTATSVSTITQPTAISLSATGTNDTDPSLSTDNGTINLTVAGGTSPYTFLWSNGAMTEDLSGLERGTYTVTVTDANNCTATLSYAIWEPELCNDGIDNDNDGLTDCDDPDCKPAAPASINNPPVCVAAGVTYTATGSSATQYLWTVPSSATINTIPTAGYYPSSINVTWNSTQGGNLCVRASVDGCNSDQVCITVVCTAVPATPTNLTID